MKKILYFIPFALWSIFYIYIGRVDSFGSLNPIVWFYLGLLFVSGILMTMNQWWGCTCGILFGVLLIMMGFKESGQIINEIPFGMIICIYYAYLGMNLYKSN